MTGTVRGFILTDIERVGDSCAFVLGGSPWLAPKGSQVTGVSGEEWRDAEEWMQQRYPVSG